MHDAHPSTITKLLQRCRDHAVSYRGLHNELLLKLLLIINCRQEVNTYRTGSVLFAELCCRDAGKLDILPLSVSS